MEHNLAVTPNRFFVELRNTVQNFTNDNEVFLIGSSVVRPRQVLEVGDGPCISQEKFAFNEVGHHSLNRNKRDEFVVELDALLHVGWPVLIALLLAVLLGGSQHHNQRHFLLLYHAPEVFNGGH